MYMQCLLRLAPLVPVMGVKVEDHGMWFGRHTRARTLNTWLRFTKQFMNNPKVQESGGYLHVCIWNIQVNVDVVVEDVGYANEAGSQQPPHANLDCEGEVFQSDTIERSMVSTVTFGWMEYLLRQGMHPC